MVTSGITAWSRSAGDIMKEAMVELGAISQGDTPEASEYEAMIDRLNGYLQELTAEGLMFREATGTLTVLAGIGGATLPAGVEEVSSVRIVKTGGIQHPLAEWNRSDYYSIPNRTQTGQYPYAYYIKKGIDSNEIVLWPVPTGAVSLHIDYQRPVDVVTGPDQTIDMPQKWYNCVMMNLASRCASIFGAERLDPQKVARVDGRAQQLHQRLLDDDRPNSYIFEAYHA